MATEHNKPLNLRLCFLRGFYDAMDAWSKPSVDLKGDPDKLKAWQAGWDHWDTLVKNEQKRLEDTAKSGDGFPDW